MGDSHVVKSRQRGTYAIEFAFVFPVFFLVLYAILTYSLIFAAQQTLNFAAEDAARTALRWQPGETGTTVENRMAAARSRAVELTEWVNSLAGARQIEIQVCPRGPGAGMAASIGGHAHLCQQASTGTAHYSSDTIEIVMRYHYRLAPLVPVLGPDALFHFLIPDVLYGRASVDLGIGLGLA